MKRTRLLLDKETGLLWLNDRDNNGSWDFIERPNLPTLDLATCEEVIAEAVCAVKYTLCMQCDLYVYKDNNDMMTVLMPYYDSMASGATYASICPGFSFRKVYSYFYNCEVFIVAELKDMKWGVIRISSNNSPWIFGKKSYLMPIEVVPFNCKSQEDALMQIRLSFSAAEIDNFKHHYVGDLSNVPDDMNYFAGSSGIDGDTIQDILSRRESSQNCRPTIF